MPTINSFIRVLHASPGTPAIDIYANGNLIFQNLAYNEISEYLPVGPGVMHIQVFAAGEESNPLIDTELNIPPSERITIAAIGTLPDISLLPILLSVQPAETLETLLRFTHLSPNAPRVDVTTTDGTVLVHDIGYTEVSNFETVASGTYSLQLRLANEEEVVLTSEPLEFIPGYAYTVYAVGLAGEEPPLEIDYYKDQIPYIGDRLDVKTEFRKPIASAKNPPKINITYS